MAKTTTLFQRFKSQNVGGKSYPWFKPYKFIYESVDAAPEPQKTLYSISVQISEKLPKIKVTTADEVPESDSRRSSDCYEEPITLWLVRTNDAEYGLETSVIDGPRRVVPRDVDKPDFFKPKRLIDLKALSEDDVAAKSISFLWWYLFLLGRMLAISSFAYFYQTEIIWLLSCHFILVLALLLYDVKHIQVRRTKAIFLYS